jgi:hypothetical protein
VSAIPFGQNIIQIGGHANEKDHKAKEEERKVKGFMIPTAGGLPPRRFW